MNSDLSTALGRLEPDPFWRGTRWVLIAGLTLGLGFILLGAALSVTIQLALAALLVGGLAFALLARDEVALLCAVLVGFVAVVRYAEGFQVEEVVYGLVYLGYLAYWFISRLFFYRDEILRTPIDWALFLFLIYVSLSLVLTPVLDGDMSAAVSEWSSISMLAFYFPIKEVCILRRDRIPQKPILYSLWALALFVAIRNMLDYKTGLSEAVYLWQIASGRVVMNEHVLMMAGLVTLVFLLYARRWIPRSILGLLFTVFSIGVIIGQSRAVWVSFALGIAVIFLLVDRKQRIQITVFGVLGLAAILVFGSVVFDDFFTLIAAGLTDRLLSLTTAATKDVSLINRFVEMEAVWEHVRQNPIVGHGLGVPYDYYSLVFEATRVSSYVHNGYVGVLYRHGLIGFVLLYFFYVGTIWTAFRTARAGKSGSLDALIAVSAVAFLVAESLVANAANPFATADTAFIIGSIAGLAAASYHNAAPGIAPPRGMEP